MRWSSAHFKSQGATPIVFHIADHQSGIFVEPKNCDSIQFSALFKKYAAEASSRIEAIPEIYLRNALKWAEFKNFSVKTLSYTR